jgi:hypothetical protein
MLRRGGSAAVTLEFIGVPELRKRELKTDDSY